MKKLTIEHEGVLIRNPRPGYKAECSYLPNVISLSETELLCFYRTGQAFYSVDGKLARLRSRDEGRTWQPEGAVWDPRKDPKPHSYTAPHGTRLRDGTLLLLAWRSDGSDPDRLMHNPETGGMAAIDNVLFTSEDGGRSWSAPQRLDLPGNGVTDTPSQIIELNSGEWFMPCEVWKTWDDTRPLHIKGFCLFSKDRGKTWGDRVDLPSASDKENMFSHSRYARMRDGRIGVLQWAQKIGSAENLDLHFTVSDVTGRDWTYPQPTGILGQTSWVADLGDGVLAAVYSSREGMNPGISVVLSRDEGQTWDLEHPLMVWDAVGQEYLGVAHKPAYPASHDNIAFGKPNLLALSDGSLICSWWCTQACVTHARFAKLRME